jgi:hypothetical protein
MSLVLLAACPAKTEEKKKDPPSRMRTATMGELPDPDAPAPDPLAALAAPSAPSDAARDTLVLVVLGSARADHVAWCGGRAHTPFLATLRDAHKAATTCDVIATTPWDAPAMIDLLTGVASSASDAPAEPLPVTLKARGFTSVLVNTRPVAPTDAWTQSFDAAHTAPNARAWRYGGVGPAVDKALAKADAKKPLLLVVVLSDAEDPWAPVPRLRWGRNQDWLSLTRSDGTRDPREVGLRNGELPLDVEDRFRMQLAAGYDHGLELADANTRAVIASLQASGRDLSKMRLVVVGDHGAALGERGLIGDAPVTFESSVRVPLVAVDTAAPTAPVPPLLSTLAVRGWLLDGVWSADAPPVALARANADGTGRVTMASTWSSPTAKLTWREGKWEAFDLTTDRDEAAPIAPAVEDPRVLTLTPWVSASGAAKP